MKKIAVLSMLLLLIFQNLAISAQEFFIEDANEIDPNLDEVRKLFENDETMIRLLLYRSGFDNITATILFQKFSITRNRGLNFQLEQTLPIREINRVYNIGIENIERVNETFVLTLSGFHAYLYRETTITLVITKDLEYEIEFDPNVNTPIR